MMSEAEVAAALSIEEGRPVTLLEVRRVEAQAMRKVRDWLRRRDLTADDLLPENDLAGWGRPPMVAGRR